MRCMSKLPAMIRPTRTILPQSADRYFEGSHLDLETVTIGHKCKVEEKKEKGSNNNSKSLISHSIEQFQHKLSGNLKNSSFKTLRFIRCMSNIQTRVFHSRYVRNACNLFPKAKCLPNELVSYSFTITNKSQISDDVTPAV